MKTVIQYVDVYLPLTESWIYEQIRNLREYNPIIYAHDTENIDVYPARKIRSLGLKRGPRNLYVIFNAAWKKIFRFYPSFAGFLLKDNPSLVHAHFGPSGYRFLKLKRIFKIPLITTFYGHDVGALPFNYPEWKTKYRALFEEGDLFLAEGHHMKARLSELGCPEEKIVVQHLGIDLEQIIFAPREIGEDGEIRILITASFREKKGIPYAVEAFGRIKQSNPDKKMKLTIIGDSGGSVAEEMEKKKIINVIEKYECEKHITMLGYQPHAAFVRELHSHHIFLHPSVHASNGDIEGGVPVSIIEASASGMPVLSTLHCDIPEVVIEGKSGYLVPERDVEALTERLEFLVCNQSRWKGMGLHGRDHIEENYNSALQVQKLEALYTMVLGNADL